MKKAHNTYTENRTWELARSVSQKYSDILISELCKHPAGSSSAFADMLIKFGLLLIRPDLVYDKEIDWVPAIKYAKKHGLPISKYVSQML